MDIFNTPFIHVAGGDVARSDEVAQPGGSVFIDFVVVSGHGLDGLLEKLDNLGGGL